MQNENIKNQPNQIRRNPTRNNTNINRGQNEKEFDAQAGSNRKLNVNPSQLDDDEVDLDRSGVADPDDREDAGFSSGAEDAEEKSDGVTNVKDDEANPYQQSNQTQTGGGAGYGATAKGQFNQQQDDSRRV